MGKAMFYHLTRRPLEAVLPMLLERSLGQGWRVVVRGREAQRMDWLDQKLWLGSEEGFLPHGQAGGPHDSAQPVLLTIGAEMPNDPQVLMSVDGAEVGADEVQGLDRVCILFDGQDGAAVQMARGQWKTLTGAGVTAEYWSEESGRWEKVTESAGS